MDCDFLGAAIGSNNHSLHLIIPIIVKTMIFGYNETIIKARKSYD